MLGKDQPPLEVNLLIGGAERKGQATLPIVNPATEAVIGSVAVASVQDLDDALAAAQAAFLPWKADGAARGHILRKGASLLRERAAGIARLLTLEQGKPLDQAAGELVLAAEVLDWFADEIARTSGRIVARPGDARHVVTPVPIGPVAAFTPWNFPLLLSARKIAPALAAGCTIIIKPSEETPAAVFEMCRALLDAGLPDGVLNVVYGRPSQISEHLVASPVIRKISLTGSVEVGRTVGALAGHHLKPSTMELGGHSPVIVMPDVDAAAVAAMSAIGKTRNAGQVCTSPTRFYVHAAVHDRFLERFVADLAKMTVGNGLDAGTQIGPLANRRRVEAMEAIVADARARGATVATGGARIDGPGYFFQPTVLTNVPADALALTSEPFGPIAIVAPFDDLDEVLARANSLDFGLAGYAFTRDAAVASRLSEELEVGVVGVNSFAVSNADTPFGGIKNSGHGYEGGAEGMAAYTHAKYVHHA